MTKQLNIKLEDSVISRLETLAARTGRSKTFYATEAILEHIADYEDYYIAKDALEEFRQSDDASVALSDVEWPS